MVGGMVMGHGDDSGVVVPPRLAPIQVVVVPIYRGDDDRVRVLEKANEIVVRLRDDGVRVHLDDRDHLTPGVKFFEWELKGVPFRVEIGPKDLEKGQVALARRVRGEDDPRKEFLPEGEALATLPSRLEDFQRELLERSIRRREENTHRGIENWDEMKEILESEGGFVYTGWSGDPEVEARVKAEMKATARVIPDEDFRSESPPTRCIGGEAASKMEVAWARAY